jgi:hypothetical protein
MTKAKGYFIRFTKSVGIISLVSLDSGNTKILADLTSQVVIDLTMSRYCRTLVLTGIVPPRMPTTFPQQLTTVSSKMAKKLIPLHKAIGVSSNPSPAASNASRRFNSNASRRVTFSVSSNSSFVRSWQLTPGTSSTHPIHQ